MTTQVEQRQLDDRAAGEKLGGEFLGYRRTDLVPIFKASKLGVGDVLRSNGYEHRTWPAQKTLADEWPSLRGWALPEDH